jgi:hypothetical protein
VVCLEVARLSDSHQTTFTRQGFTELARFLDFNSVLAIDRPAQVRNGAGDINFRMLPIMKSMFNIHVQYLFDH